jgi:hypothetical protein
MCLHRIAALMLEEVGKFRPDWYATQMHPDQYELEIEEDKPPAST